MSTTPQDPEQQRTQRPPAQQDGRPEPDEAPDTGAGHSSSAAQDGAPPRPAEGVELIGEYEDSGFKEAPYIARRADGQVIQMPKLLYLVAEAADGRRSYEEIAKVVSAQFKRGLDPGMVRQLVDEQLRPLGVLAQADGSTPELQKADPMLALKLKTAVVPEGLVNAVTTIFRPLFFPPVIVAVLAGLVAVDVWLFFVHGVAQSLRQTLYDPVFVLVLLGLVVLSAAFHEVGHATACRYGGARPGAMGVGLYIVWPAFYTDVTDAYRLGKGGRLRTDLGGVYFNVIFILATVGAYGATGWEPLLLLIPLQHMEILHQFLPFLRLDGYYIVSDLTGVPDMFARIKPTLASMLPWKKTPDAVQVLKPWVRFATTLYVLTVVPLLLFFLGFTVVNVPRIVATAWDSFNVQLDKLGDASAFGVVMGVLQMAILALPVVGILYTFVLLGRKTFAGGWNRTEGRPVLRGAFVTSFAAVVAGVGWIWAPNGEYRPIQPDERGTVQGAIKQLAAVPTGRPGLTEERERELGGAPGRSSEDGAPPGDEPAPGESPASTTETETTSTTETETAPTETEPAATAPGETAPGETTTTETTTTTSTVTPP